MRHSVREYINHRRGAEWVATKVASALLILRKEQVGGGKKQGRQEGREGGGEVWSEHTER